MKINLHVDELVKLDYYGCDVKEHWHRREWLRDSITDEAVDVAVKQNGLEGTSVGGENA